MPDLDNHTKLSVEVVPVIGKEGHSLAVVIAKGTYEIGLAGDMELAADQLPISFKDESAGESGNEIRIPSDIIDYKPATDVVIVRPSPDLERNILFGREFLVKIGSVQVSGKVGGAWKWGPLRRDKKPRRDFAGTYNRDWIDNRMPLLPEDFDPRYHQVVAPSQQVQGYLNGGEHIKLVNFHGEDTSREAKLPDRTVLVAGNVLNRYFADIAVMDTALIWMENSRITLVWRHVIRPRRKVEEICNVHVYLVRLRTARALCGKP